MNSNKAAREMQVCLKGRKILQHPSSQPETKAVEIVMPDLDTPGKIAIAVRPIKKLSE